jgi:GNAT superfamily N-acetyltransferase
VVAPFNGAALFGAGLRTDAHGESPMFPTAWTPPYYVAYVAAAGFAPTYPLWFYTIDFSSERYRAAKRRAAENRAATVRPIDKKKWRQELEVYLGLFNETFKEEWEFHPMTIEEFREFFDPIKPLLDPNQMLLAEVDGQPAGWCLGFPDWTPLFRSFQGKVGPLQLLKLFMKAGQYDRAGLVGIGVLEGFKGAGVAHALAARLYGYYEQRGLTGALYYPVNESNLRSRKFAESMGGTGRVLYHCYDKHVG